MAGIVVLSSICNVQDFDIRHASTPSGDGEHALKGEPLLLMFAICLL